MRSLAFFLPVGISKHIAVLDRMRSLLRDIPVRSARSKHAAAWSATSSCPPRCIILIAHEPTPRGPCAEEEERDL
jgi:hypothetical protein